MSAFLGKIHYWLYNKILWHEGILEEILRFAAAKNIPVGEIKDSIYDQYGAPDLRPLEEVIDHQNIHGWLQARIQSVEYRIAAVIIKLTDKYGIKIEDLMQVYEENAKRAAALIDASSSSPKELFGYVFDFMLSGMPCDRVNETVLDAEEEFSWSIVTCIHKEYWNALGGDVNNYYRLQDAWIGSFIHAANPNYSFTHSEDGIRTIKRR